MSNDAADRVGRPEYGEYATPEQQATARGFVDEAHESPAPAVSYAAPHAAPYSQAVPDAAAAASAPRPRTADRIVTIALLSFGLVNIVLGIPGFLALADTLQQAYDQAGIGTYTSTALTATLGIVAIVAQLVIWGSAAVASIALMRRGRLAWWVALVGGAVAVLVVLIVFTIAITSDPAFSAYVAEQAVLR